MARDYRALEEEFIADLKTRSGRSLTEWMTAIATTGITDRNAIIDWLQPQGFTFEHASWLERIHNNDGQPIYADQRPGERRPAPPAAPPAPPPPARADATAMPPRPPPVPRPPAVAAPGSVEALLARGKAFRMLADLLLAEIRRAIPEVAITAAGDQILLAHPATFAALSVTPRELRLGLALADRPLTPPLVRPKGLGADPALTHMLVLTDARQVDDGLIELLRQADRGVNTAT